MASHRRSKELLHVDGLARRHRHRPVLIDDPLIETQEAYAHNVFVSTVLRRLDRGHLNSLEDAELVKSWARTVTCSGCARETTLEGAPTIRASGATHRGVQDDPVKQGFGVDPSRASRASAMPGTDLSIEHEATPALQRR